MQKLTLSALQRLSKSEFAQAPKFPFVLILDNIRSALNVGSVFRTADAFAAQGLALCGISACPPHRDILKTALGATDTVAWAYFETTRAAVEHYKTQHYKIWAIEQTDSSLSLEQFNPDLSESPLALILGNEVEGVDANLLDLVDGCVEIPQFGTKHSLNVSVCAGIVAWELVRKQI
jgi:23S rRNA (guanosine2251-2'-O)-methyltransferase